MNSVLQHPGRVVAIGLAIGIALLALLPGTWQAARAQTAGAASTATPVSTSVSAGAAATVEAAPNRVIRIPAGALSQEATIVSQPILDNAGGEQVAVAEIFAQLNVPSPEEVQNGAAVVISIFQLDALDADGNEITFDEPVEMDFELTPEILAAAGGDANNIVLQFFDEATNSWTPVECSGSGTTLTCILPHFSIWSLVVRVQQPAQQAPATTPAPASTGMGETSSGATDTMAIVLGAVALAAVAGVGYRMVMRRSRS